MPTAAGLVIIGLLAAIAGTQALWRYWQLRTPATPVLLLSPSSSPVEVAGVATPTDSESLVRSPFTDTQCLVCTSRVDAYYPNHTSSDSEIHPADLLAPDGWRVVYEGETSVPFYVDDGTAKVPVDPDGADLRLSVHGRTVRAGESLPEYDPLREFLEIEGEREGSAWARNVLRAGDPTTIDRVASVLELNGPTHWEFVEYLLEPDEPVHVYGVPAPRRTESHEVGVVHAVFASRGLPKGSTGRTLALKPTDRPLVISEGTESEAESWALYGGLVRVTVGALAVGVGALSLLASFTG